MENVIIPLKLYLCHETKGAGGAYCLWDRVSIKKRGFGRDEVWVPKRGITKVKRIQDNVWLFMVPEKIAQQKRLINEDTA